MVPRALQDAGYTAVGLGVLALAQLKSRRGEIIRTLETGLAGARTLASPVTSRLEGFPKLPGPVGGAVEFGRARLCAALAP